MNKLTKLGIVTFSAVTLSAVVPTLVHAEENVAPQPNAAARPTIQPTLTPKPNNNWVDYSMLDPIAKPKPKPKPGKEVSKPADSNKNETPTDETTGKSASKPKEELKSVDEKTRLAELKTKYDVDPSNKEIDTTLTMSAAEIVKGLNTEEDKKRTETLAAAGVASSIVEHDAIVFEETRKVFLSTGVDITKPPFTKSNPNDPYEAVAAVATYPEPKYIIKAIYMDAAKLKKFGYTEKAHVSDITPSELSYPNGEKFEGGYTLVDSYNHHINSVQEGSNIKLVGTKWDYDEIQRNSNAHIKELVAPEIKGYTFSHVEKARDLPDLSTDPRVVKVDYESIYHMHGGKSVLDSSFYLDILHYYFIYNKDEIAKEIPNPEINNTKPAEDTTLKPAEQPASNPVANTQPTANPTPTLKPAENPQPEVKPAEQPQPAKPVEPAEKPSIPEKPATPAKPEVKPVDQPQPTKPVEPAENAGLPKVPYRNDQPKRWFNNGTGRPTLTTNDLAAPLPAENVEKTSYGWWTAEPDLLHAGSHIKVNTFNSNFNNPMFENGKEIKFKGSGFGDMDSRFKPALVRVKVPELEGMNYEAYTIFYEVPNKNGNPTYGTNRTLQGGNVALTFKSKEKKEDIQVYTLTKDRKLEELYYLGFPSEETNRYDEKTKTHSYNLYGETYDTYVFLFKNPAEKPAEQVKPEVKPSEQPKPDKQPSVPTVPAEQPQPTKPVEPAEKPSEQPKPDKQPSVPTVPAEQPQPTKPVEPAKPEVKPAEQPQENNIKSVRKWRLADGSFHEHPILTHSDIIAPLPIGDMKQTPINGIWTAEKDFVNNKPRLTLFWGSGNRYFEENGKEFSREELMKSTMYMYPIRVKIPELEGRNYEAYTIYTGIRDKKTGHVELNKNTNITGEGYMVFRTKKEDNDVEVYQFSKNRELAPLYSSRQLNERGRSVGEFGLSAEVYQTYVFLFKNPAEKPAEQVKPEVKPSEQPKPDKQPSVPTIPADQPQPTKPVQPAEKPSEQPKPDKQPSVPTVPAEQPQPTKPVEPAEKPSEQPKPDKQPSVPPVPADQSQPAKPEKPAEKPSEKPVNPVTPVAPITPTTPVTPTLNPAIPNNTRVLSNKAGSVQVHGSEATLKNVSYIKVEETKPTSLESKDYKAFDIHLYDANGKAIQPNGMVLVSLSADKPVENVYYVAPDGTLQALNFKQDTDKVTFETNHFSIYAMTFKVAASRDNVGTTTPVPVVNSSNAPTTTEQKGNDASSTKTQAEPLATKTETISKHVAKTLPNTGENNSIFATLFGMLTLTAGLFSFRKESE